MISGYIFRVIIGCALVTIAVRIIPFIMTKKMNIPKKVETWLSFVPVSIFAALVTQTMIDKTDDNFGIDFPVLLALIPTFIVAVKTKSMIRTVIVGVVCMALLRMVF